ncbi:MAG: ComEC/Rec2 family competence protein [Candidatus Omnitrophota bacterium]|nr:ComEC/Rec2 family competence protein [Candidatus Omnitrophota bacterium]
MLKGSLLNFWLFLSFGLGIILSVYLNSFLTLLILSLVSIILALIFYKKQRFLISDLFILILFISLGALSYISRQYHKIDSFLNEENIYTIKVISLPQEHHLKNTFLSEIKKVNGISVTQTVKAMDHTKAMAYLNIYELKAKLTKNQYQNRDFYALWVKSQVLPKELPQNIWDRFTKKVSYNLINIFKSNLTDESYRFLSSVSLGRRELLEKEEKDIFRDAGISHLLAISGSNISLVAVVLFFILKLFSVRFRPRLFVSFIFLFIYTIIAGANPPVLRATIMYLVFALGYFAKRKVNPYNSLGLAGLVCLLINPSWLFDVGFQLSFLSIFALIVGFKAFAVQPSKIVFINYLKYLFLSSFFVTLFITPLVSYYFGRIYILSIFNNIILIPFFSLILVINFLLIVFSPFKLIAESIGAVLSLLIPLFYKLSDFLGSIKFSFIVWKFNLLSIILYYFILVITISYWRYHKKSWLHANY